MVERYSQRGIRGGRRREEEGEGWREEEEGVEKKEGRLTLE